MPICNEILYGILSFFDITMCEDVTTVKQIFDIDLPKCLLSTDPNDINKHHPFWRYWITRTNICHKNCMVNGLLHSLNDIPFRELVSESWYRHGKLHRDNDLPAMIFTDGSCEWYKDDKLHRDNDMPALIYSTGTNEWYRDGKLHRDNDLPASIIHANGYKAYYHDGKRYKHNTL